MEISNGFLVEVDGTPLPSDVEQLLSSAYVDDSLHLPDLFVLRFRDPDRVVIPKTGVAVGATVRISIVSSGSQGPRPMVTGEVTALEAEFDSGGTFTVVRGYDHAHRLFRGRRTETYAQMTASDIARKVAERAQLRIGTIEATTTVFDHVTQGGVTDWRFLSGLAREAGYEMVVQDGRFSFRRPRPAAEAPDAGGRPVTDPLVLHMGTDLLRLRTVVTAAEQVKEVQVRGWDVAAKRALVADAPARTTSAELPAVTPTALADAFGAPVYVATDVPYRSQSEVDAAAGALAEQIAGAFAELEGVARGNPELRAGTAIALDNLGVPFDGKYTVTSSRHLYDSTSGYTTSVAVTGRHERSLYGLTSGGAAAPAAPGVVIAQVSDVNDPQQQGRVRLTFPWLSDDHVSDWSRTVQPGAGKDRGAMVVPEVGDEVLVAFEQGDIRRPYVLGGLYNGVDTPRPGAVGLVDPGSGAVNRRSVVSRRGHRIDLLDEDGRAEGISLSTGDGGLRLVLDATGTAITVAGDGTVLVEGTKGVVVDAAGSKLELRGGQIELTAQRGVTVDGGGGPVEVTAGGPLSLTGTTATLEGSAQTEVKGGALCSVRAALVRIN
ncbi:VgrG-related protein [Geodermatophilus sp. SYSU D00703]